MDTLLQSGWKMKRRAKIVVTDVRSVLMLKQKAHNEALKIMRMGG